MSSEDYLLTLLSKPQKKSEETMVVNNRACPCIKYFNDKVSVKYTGKGIYSEIAVK